MIRAAPVALAVLAIACAHRAPGTSQAEVRNWVYADNRGLLVVTTAAGTVQPISDDVTVEVHALVDHVHIAAPKGEPIVDPSHPGLTGHDHDGDGHPDALTGASVPVAPSSEAITEWRFEGAAEVTWSRPVGEADTALSVGVRGSTESDYDSVSGTVGGVVAFGGGRSVLDAYVGFGHDVSSPPEAPPGQTGDWPASQDRAFWGLSVDQIVDKRTRLAFGASGSLQWGTLESPYRFVYVNTTLFPESVPDFRARFVVSVTASRYLGRGVALHLRPAFYADTWGVVAAIPEGALSVELGSRGLLTLRYRWYRQTKATLYHEHYHEMAEVMPGDSRLGPINDHVPGVAVRWIATESEDGVRRLVLSAGYDFSWLTWPGYGLEPLVAHLPMFGLTGTW